MRRDADDLEAAPGIGKSLIEESRDARAARRPAVPIL
jgi:hypothetical protein